MEDYSKTVYLPKTPFPMKANLSQRESGYLEHWEAISLYHKMVGRNKGNPSYVLHDGPPYANGHIHLGTSLNKILKDVVIKYKSMRGFYAPYVPGWDCHGMPIEHQIFKELKEKKADVDIIQFRKKAAAFARKFVEIQKEEFKRLGVLAEWDKPYLTLDPDYQGDIVKAFGELALQGYIYQTYKPIYWCIKCETALAEAEVEYENLKSPSIYVKFPLVDGSREDCKKPVYLLIWTTTPWTLPANTAIAVHPELSYVLVESEDEQFIMAEALVKEVFEKAGRAWKIIDRFTGRQLEGRQYSNPLVERVAQVILADFVSAEDGTGCVHNAPGHGEDDYYAGLKNNLEILSPVDARGCFTEEVPAYCGTKVFDADPLITDHLKEDNYLFFAESVKHSYPHCWRCKSPVIFRSTKQWFMKIDHNNLRDGCLKKELKRVRWIPPEGEKRITAMVESRPDWCLSRQRLWGVAIPAFYCKQCGKTVITAETIAKIERLVRQHSADIWMEKEASELLPDGFKCGECGSVEFEKEYDILDVWFDSGTSHMAVLNNRYGLQWPADLYLEGSDQHRGWFQTSLITSCGIKGQAPYRAVLTHGFVVAADGRKMSKSLGNFIAPEKIIKQHGAEILRIWSVAENYQQDIRISEDILKNIILAYRNIRNTIRFLLGNLSDFNPAEAVPEGELSGEDRLAVEKLKAVSESITEQYEKFAFNKAYEEIHSYCNISLSSFYLDIIKDRLYTCGKDSRERKSAQTVLHIILSSFIRIIAPVLSFTAEEAYQCMPWPKKESIFLEDWPEFDTPDKELLSQWEKFFLLRKDILKKIEDQRVAKILGSSLEAKVTISAPEETLNYLSNFNNLKQLLIVSEVVLEAADRLSIRVEKTSFEKCHRCWVHYPEVGTDKEMPELCNKCSHVIKTDIFTE